MFRSDSLQRKPSQLACLRHVTGFPRLGLRRKLRQSARHRGHAPLASDTGLTRFINLDSSMLIRLPPSHSLPLLAASRWGATVFGVTDTVVPAHDLRMSWVLLYRWLHIPEKPSASPKAITTSPETQSASATDAPSAIYVNWLCSCMNSQSTTTAWRWSATINPGFANCSRLETGACCTMRPACLNGPSPLRPCVCRISAYDVRRVGRRMPFRWSPVTRPTTAPCRRRQPG